MKKFFVLFVALGLLLAACGGQDTVVGNPVQPANDNNNDSGSADQPSDLPDQPETPIINEPGETPFQDQPQEPGQGDWVRGNAFVNSVDMVIRESYPIQIGLYIEGELPTPCNKLTIDIAEPDADNNIHVEVYSLVNPAETCIQVIEPFGENITLPTADLADGTYSVFVNGTLVGEFTYPGG